MAFGHLVPQLKLEEATEDVLFTNISMLHSSQHALNQLGKTVSPENTRKQQNQILNFLASFFSSKGVTMGPQLMSRHWEIDLAEHLPITISAPRCLSSLGSLLSKAAQTCSNQGHISRIAAEEKLMSLFCGLKA
ncbi:unnamed protein product [Lota lota]